MDDTDDATVAIGTEDGNVWIDTRPAGGCHYLTPAKARIMAASLLRCADEVDAKFFPDWDKS